MIEDNKDLLNDEETSEEVDTNEEVTEEYEETEDYEEVEDNTRIFDGTEVEDEAEYEEEEEEYEEEPNGGGPKKDMKKILIPIIIAAIVVLAVLIFVILQGGGNKDNDPTTSPSGTTTTTPSGETIDWSTYPEIWDANYAINSDYVGEIIFESGIINLPMVQYSGQGTAYNAGYDKYLRTDWKTMEYSEEGSIFVDPYVDLATSTNITIYGHYVYESLDPTRTRFFTPLELLIDEENYEDNKYFYLVLENEVRKYEIAYVYYAELTGDPIKPLADGMNYMFTEWTDEELEYYLSEVEKVQFYDTGVDIEPGDKFVTLQTCVENDDMRREIVVAKEVEVQSIR